MPLTSTLGPSALNVFVQSQIPALTLQGLSNGSWYGLKQDGTLTGAVPNPQTTATAANFASAGVNEGNGIFFIPPQAKALLVHVQAGTQTGMAGGGLVIMPMFYPFLPVTPPIASGNPTPINITGANLLQIIPTSLSNAPISVSAGAGIFASRVFFAAITATTWPSAGARLDIQIEWV